MTLRSDYPHNSTKRRLNSTDVHRAPRFHDSAYQSAIASVSRRGRVKRQVRYALIATGRPLTTGELLPWAYPRLTKFKDWHRRSVRRALRQLCSKVGRRRTIGCPDLWALR
jgi:hypothetical protein